MLKTYRIIPLVFILFLFGFTLISVAPVLAQTTQDNESRISALEDAFCDTGQGRRLEFCIEREREASEARMRKVMKAEEAEREAAEARSRERTKNWDKDPYTYSPNGNPRQSPDRKFRCIGYPEIRENPDEPRGVAHAKCQQKFDEAKK